MGSDAGKCNKISISESCVSGVCSYNRKTHVREEHSKIRTHKLMYKMYTVK